MNIRTEKQRDALVKALTHAPVPLSVQQVTIRGHVTIFTGVGSPHAGVIRVDPDGTTRTR